MKSAPSGLPGRSVLQKNMGSKAAVGVVTGYYRAESGRPVLDVQVGPRRYEAVPLHTVEGGGGPNRYTHFAVETDPVRPVQVNPDGTNAAQVRLEFDAATGQPRAVGFVHHRDLGLVQTVATPSQTANRSTGVTAKDHAIANGGAIIIVDSRGAFVLDVTAAEDGNVRVQLPAAGVLRVARGGAADDRAVSGAQLLAYLAQLEAVVSGILTSLGTATAAGAGATLAFPDPLPLNVPTADNTLKLAALHISADTEV